MNPNRIYYILKPYLPWRLRMGLRRVMARRQRRKHQAVWPINEAAGNPPPGWAGWPDGKKFAFVLTHDVEGPAGLAKCRQLMKLEQERGFHSSFNFIPEGDYEVTRELRKELAQNGFEVGVHDLHHDGKLYESRQAFSEKARKINRYLREWGAAGFRGGFMLRELDWIHELNIQYDASTFDTDPFEPQPNGGGTIFPFWIPEPETQKSGIVNEPPGRSPASVPPHPLRGSGYVELPYTLPQDSTMFFVLQEKSPAIWKQKLDWIARRGGMALINVHPDYLRFPEEVAAAKTFPVSHYSELLDYVRKNYAGTYWQPLARDMAAFVSGVDAARPNGRAQSLTDNGVVPESQPVLPGLANNVIGSAPAAAPTGVAMNKTGNGNNVLNCARSEPAGQPDASNAKSARLSGKKIGVLLFSHYPSDPRPKRAAEAMAREGAEVDFLCLQGGPEQPMRETANDLNIFRVPLKRRRGGKPVYFFQYGVFLAAAFFFLAWRTLRRRYDLVHVHNMPDVLVFAALVPKLLGAQVILDLHDPMPELMTTIFKLPEQSFAVRFLKQAEKWSIRFADLVLTPNVAFQKLFSSRSCPPEKIHIVMNSPNEETFPFRNVASTAPARNPSDPFVILYHGSLVARHGLDLAIDAIEQVRKSIPNATITICGENTPYFEDVMKSVAARRLEPMVRYLGLRDRRQIREAIEQCDLGVIPNRRSIFTELNMPTRIFEYLALGKPVIAPSTHGIQDYFNQPELIFFEPDNVADLAQKIEYVASHPREVLEIVKRGQAVYRQHTWTQERSKLIELVGSLLDARDGRLTNTGQNYSTVIKP
jgi:glycosyltransferase involved in cell wall biosynthesis